MRRFLYIPVLLLLSSALYSQSANQAILNGNELYRQGRYEEAIKQYDAALKTEPGNMTAKFNLASATYRLNNEADAIKGYEEVITKEQEKDLKAKSFYNKGSILSKQNKLEESIELYKNALRNDPSDMEARENLQKALLELKKKEPPKKKEDEKKKKQDKQQQQQKQKQQQQPKLNQKEAEQRLKLLEQKEKEVQMRLQKQKASGGGSQNKDW